LNPELNLNTKSNWKSLKGKVFYKINKSGKEIANPRGKKTLLYLYLIFLEKDHKQCKLQKNEICYKSTPILFQIKLTRWIRYKIIIIKNNFPEVTKVKVERINPH